MNKTELLKELRSITSAGLGDCKTALQEANYDLHKAIDLIKIRGLNIANNLSGRATSEGMISLQVNHNGAAMVHIGCNTDFVAKSELFQDFMVQALSTLSSCGLTFDPAEIQEQRQTLSAATKENIEIKRWTFISQEPNQFIFGYLHANSKIGVLLTLKADTNTPELALLGANLAMQVAALNPIAVSFDRVVASDLERQKSIFQAQMQEEKKPAAIFDKIMEGKLRKWTTEVCLLDQESITSPKSSVRKTIQDVEKKIGNIEVVNFIRYSI